MKQQYLWLTHLGRVAHICVNKLTIIGSDNGLVPGRRQTSIWTNAGTFLIGPLGTNFSEILIAIETFSFKKMHLKISSAKWRPFCLGLSELTHWGWNKVTAILQMTFSNAFSCMKMYEFKNEWNCHHFKDDICQCIFLKERFCILISISLKFLCQDQTYNI